MTDHEFPQPAEIETAYRSAYRALAALLPPDTVIPEEESDLSEVLSQFRGLVDNAELVTVGQLGALVSWRGPHRDGNWEPIISGVDLDGYSHDFGDVELGTDAFEGPTGRWPGSALDRVGLAYKRACRWDCPPGDAGVWLVMLAPESGIGGDDGDPWSYRGRIVGFVVLYDRDEDDAYESVGHIWTATAWRRRGIAQRLLAEARSRFPVTGVEGPYTNDGAAFLAACPDPKDRPQD